MVRQWNKKILKPLLPWALKKSGKKVWSKERRKKKSNWIYKMYLQEISQGQLQKPRMSLKKGKGLFKWEKKKTFQKKSKGPEFGSKKHLRKNQWILGKTLKKKNEEKRLTKKTSGIGKISFCFCKKKKKGIDHWIFWWGLYGRDSIDKRRRFYERTTIKIIFTWNGGTDI